MANIVALWQPSDLIALPLVGGDSQTSCRKLTFLPPRDPLSTTALGVMASDMQAIMARVGATRLLQWQR